MNAVTDVLEDSKGLTYLDIGRNNVQDKGVEALTLGLRRCPTLETLILSHNNITDAGARSLAGVLPQCTALKRLSLSHNEEIGPDGESVLRKVPACSPLTIELLQRGWSKAGGGAAKK
jgi:Ran GTPase-activating protein (RanGAP) involved in mRNA processing and transport